MLIPDTLRARLLGGYVVIPTVKALRAPHRLPVRAVAIRATQRVLRKALAELDTELVDLAIEMRFKRNWKWDAIARHIGLPMPTIHRLVKARRAALGADITGLDETPTVENIAEAA